MTRSEFIQKNTQFRAPREQGQAIVLIALAIVVLMAAVGLATDGTLLYKTKQDLQRTIDSAALAAAYKLPDQTDAKQAAYEFARLHDYDFDPSSTDPLKHLQFSFPDVATRKDVTVSGSTNVNFAFLSIVGIQSMEVSAIGEAEAAPMDVYLIFDLSESMVYDTDRPTPWPPAGFTTCNTWDSSNYSDCIAKYCNWARKCDPLDLHIKPAAHFFIDKLDARYDRVGVVAYDQYGTIILPLSSDFTAVKAAIDGLNAFDHQGSSNCDITRYPYYDDKDCNKQTNIGDGIMYAHNDISIPYDPITKTGGGRLDSVWSMILMTDGKANVFRQGYGCSGCPPNCGTGCTYVHLCNECDEAKAWAINNAKDTWTRHETVIYTIAYGTNSPGFEALMIEIADRTDNGILDHHTDNFWAAPDEARLKLAFAEIAERIYSRLRR